MKKTISCIISFLLLLSCMTPIIVLADSQSTTVHYSVPATVIYMDYDGTSTTQKVDVGTLLKAPAAKGKVGYTFNGWKNEKTGQLWDFSQPVMEHLTLIADYSKYPDFKEDKNGDIPIGKGKFSVNIKVENNNTEISLETSCCEILDMLLEDGIITFEDMTRIENGALLEVVLVVKDATATISDSSRTSLKQAAGEYDIGQYLDISLIEYLTENGQMNEGTMITTTSGMITLSVKIPNSMINTDKSVERYYSVLRNHEGNVQMLDSRYDAANQTITFQTNQFSDYALAYKDVKKSEQIAEKNNDSTKKNVSISSQLPRTGYTTKFLEYGIALIVSVTGIIILLILRKKKIE